MWDEKAKGECRVRERLLQRSRMTSASLEGTHTNCRADNSHRLFFTLRRPPARGVLTLKERLGLVLSFLAICQGDPSFSAPSATNQTTDNNTWWGGTLTTNHTETNEVTWQERYCIMNVGVWTVKEQCSALMRVLKKTKHLLQKASRAAAKLGSCSSGSNKVSLSSFPK